MAKRLGVAASLLIAVLIIGAGPAAGTPEMARKEERSCVTCHTAMGRAELNEAGKYYRDKGTFEGYPGKLPPKTSFHSLRLLAPSR